MSFKVASLKMMAIHGGVCWRQGQLWISWNAKKKKKKKKKEEEEEEEEEEKYKKYKKNVSRFALKPRIIPSDSPVKMIFVEFSRLFCPR